MATFKYYYFMDKDSGQVQISLGDYYAGDFTIPDSATLGDLIPITIPGEGPDVQTYSGTDADGNVYINDATVFLTNTPAQGGYVPNYPQMWQDRLLVDFPACFLRDTAIATPHGVCFVQDLAIGDLILTADGHCVPVRWIGRQTVAALFGGGDQRAPICISAGALGENLPVRDLKLTADHALLLGGVLVQAGALVNGTTIRRMTRAETGDRYQVFHIETAGHEIIIAEGCAAETFIDNVSRKRFDNYGEYKALFGEESDAMPEMDLPRVKSARQLPTTLRDLIAVRRAA